MNCPKCLAENDENAQFCRNCGTSLHFFQTPIRGNQTADMLILIFLGYNILSELIRFALQKLVDNWYEGTAKYFIIAINLIAGLSFILLGFSISSKTGKIFGIILAALYAGYIIYSNIAWMIR